MRSLFLCFLLCAGKLLFAQQHITGKLIDAKSNQGISLANLSLTALDQSQPIKYASSDTTGFFELKEIPNGNYRLSITLMGYQEFQKMIMVTTQSPKIIALGTISMIEDLNLLKEITITGGTPNFSASNGRLKIGIANNVFFKSAVNLLDVFRKLPGLQVNQDGTMLMANGLNPKLFIDGKTVNMSNEEIQAYLGGLLPEAVETIELITQPPSKYDGEFQGIIDLKLKRNQTLGLKGSYNTRFQRNNASLFENNIAASFKTTLFTYDLNLGYTYGETYYRYHALQHQANTNIMTTDTRTITGNQNFNALARVAFEPKKDQTFEVFLRTSQMNRKANTGNQLLTQLNDHNSLVSLISSKNNALPDQFNYAGGFNYDAKFKFSELHFFTTLAQVDNHQTEDIQNLNLLNNQLLDYWKTTSRNNILIRAIQVDYSQNIGADKIEFGGKFAFTTTKNKLRYDTLANNLFSLDSERSNQFLYKEHITAAYFSYIGTLKNFNYNFGIRAEHTQSIANSISMNTNKKSAYLKWLPSFNLTYTIAQNEQLSFNFSRRLTRPTFEALNPFRFYISPLNYRVGNPDLQPSTTNLFSLAYNRKALLLSFNIGRETDPMNRYPEYDPITNVLAYLGRNLPYKDFAYLQIGAPLTLTKWWRMNNSLNIYYTKEFTPYLGKTYHIGVFNYIINGSQAFALKKWTFDISYLYESKSGSGLYYSAPVYGVDFGLQRTWLKNRMNTKFVLYNAFDTIKRRYIFREKTIIDNDFYHYFGAQRFVFNLTFNFGSSTYKARENKKSDEENRAN